MPIQNWVRRTDANNTRALANLGVGGIWTGIATYAGANYHVELLLTAVQTGVLELLQGGTAATCTVPVESVPITAGATAVPFEFNLTDSWYCFRYTQGGVAGNVGLTTTLDARALTAIRKADPNNSRALAAIGAGATWTGVGTFKGSAARVDMVLAAAQAGALVFQESEDGNTWVTVEAWATPIGAIVGYSTRLLQRFYRFVFTDAGVGGNLALFATTDPGAVDHSVPLIAPQVLAAGATTVVRPVGGRSLALVGEVAGAPLTALSTALVRDAAANVIDSYSLIAAALPRGNNRTLPTNAFDVVVTLEAAATGRVEWFQ